MQINRKRTINKGPEWIAVVNPNAGTRKVANDWSQISEALSRWSVHHAAIFTEKRGDAIELVKQQIVLGVRHFIAVGGDGTLNEVVNGIFGQGDVPTTD
ncbi:MAG: diacylglycerol kinase, partial [Bacteroidetes bacterium HGW-Bacteroidetes-22]